MACVSGLTNGVYSFVDCCGLLQTGVSLGESICLDEAYTGSSFGVYIATGVTCTQNCSQGVLSYSFQVTGVCDTGFGTVVLTPFGGIPSYTIDPITPLGSGLTAQTGNGPFSFTGLTGGTYVFRLNDSLGLQNNELFINVTISNCFFANVYDVSGSTCGSNNGYINISATTSASPYTIIVYKDGDVFDVSTSQIFPVVYNNLSSGIYYATVFDYGAVTANTENFVIDESVGVDFGLWKVNTSTCVIDKGKLAVTGLTGTPPYTFLWSTNETTQQITGLTQGTYSVTVTDSLGCSTTKSEIIGTAQPLGLGLLTSINPDCFASNGSLTFTLTGGTTPFYYSASTNEVGYTLSDTFTISNLAGGAHQVLVRDANFCQVTLGGTLNTVNGFNVVGLNVTQSNCSSSNGKIIVTLEGANNFYTYGLSGLTTNSTLGTTTQSQTYTFSNLENDTYLLVISGSGTNCSYSQFVTVNSVDKFNVSYTSNTATCDNNNGSIYVEVGNGYTGPLDFILSDGQSIIDTALTAYTFTNLSPGQYDLSVTDADDCKINKTINLGAIGNLGFMVQTQDCTGVDDGTATVIINNGKPPFIYEWSNNVPNNQTGSTVTGLTGDIYQVAVTDSNGCREEFRFEILCGGKNILQYQIVPICNSYFSSSSEVTNAGQKRDFSKMLNEGFVDLTSGYTNCIMTGATFTCEININGSAFTQTFYTSTGLNDVPQDSLWQSTIENILSSITEIGSYTVDLINNEFVIKSNCVGDVDPLGGKSVSLNLTIDYDINCEASANTMCFNFSSSTYVSNVTASPEGINNNRPYYTFPRGGITCYVYWDDVYNVWVFSETLGGDIDNSFSTLDNFYNPNPVSNMTYTWQDGPESDTFKMNTSTSGTCPYKQFQTLTNFEFMTGVPYEFQ